MIDVYLPSEAELPSLRLTRLQQEILLLVVHGLTNQQIAARLDTSPGMVGMQIGRITQRLGLARRAELVTWASQQSMLHALPDMDAVARPDGQDRPW